MSQVLIHIGYPKAGSTYLQKWFSQHPAFCFKPNALAGFNYTYELSQFAHSDKPIPENYVISSITLGAWRGEADPNAYRRKPYAFKSYDLKLYHERLGSLLNKLYPSAKLLIVTRGYQSLLLSLYSHYVRSGGILSFDEFHEEDSRNWHTFYGYTWIIAHYRKVYGRENVIVLPYELLRESPFRFTKAIEEAVGIQEHFEIGAEKVNASLERRQVAAYRKYSKLVHAILSPLPNSTRNKIYDYHCMKIYRKEHTPLLDWLARHVMSEEKMEAPDWLLQSWAGTADILREEKIYQPYLKEYLL